MKNSDPRVDAYIARAAPFARPILEHVRAAVHEGCPDVAETIKWGMPSFVREGKILCGMAAFKAHCSFGFWHHGMKDVLRADGWTGENAMGSFGRIGSLSDLPPKKKLLAYVKRAAALEAEGVPGRPRPARKSAPVKVPDDLAAALKKNKAAAKTWEAFPPSCRKEYVDWITEAKREETRAKRLATTLEWLEKGKRRNWKYEAC